VRRRLLPVALVVSAAVALAGCSSSSHPSKASASATPSAAASGPMTPVAWTGPSLPTVTGGYGDKPTITFPKVAAPKQLEKKLLTTGTGPAVAKGDLLVADYYGQVWGGKTAFDNSYDRGQPVGFTIGTGKVIQGWDDTLVGVTAGSRVLISLPPTEGYGSAGNTQAGIKGTDTLVFVVDIVSSYAGNVTSDPKAKVIAHVGGPTITGALATKPTIKIPATLAKPAKTVTTILAKGSGPLVGKELAVVQYEVVDWTGASVASTWTDGAPAGVNVAQTGATGVFDGLEGIPVGSRVLIEIPLTSGQGPYAAVVDIVAVATSAKLTAGG
jgi:peptidylprolyl isomerase